MSEASRCESFRVPPARRKREGRLAHRVNWGRVLFAFRLWDCASKGICEFGSSMNRLAVASVCVAVLLVGSGCGASQLDAEARENFEVATEVANGWEAELDIEITEATGSPERSRAMFDNREVLERPELSRRGTLMLPVGEAVAELHRAALANDLVLAEACNVVGAEGRRTALYSTPRGSWARMSAKPIDAGATTVSLVFSIPLAGEQFDIEEFSEDVPPGGTDCWPTG